MRGKHEESRVTSSFLAWVTRRLELLLAQMGKGNLGKSRSSTVNMLTLRCPVNRHMERLMDSWVHELEFPGRVPGRRDELGSYLPRDDIEAVKLGGIICELSVESRSED